MLLYRLGGKSLGAKLSVVSSLDNPLYLVEYRAKPNFLTCITFGSEAKSILS